ncbi:MAG: DNA-3-methyladenine glycosylase [Cyclobacteriaceae bacterium]|nr:DNA-3-methyladenine glycosylase [Cyclobacteriaceae bacterium]MCH8517145.1 DNA-3-methyladenine glycosylase [Cyclobacteriaceae bacterium]
MKQLKSDFFQQDDVLQIAQDLIGMELVSRVGGEYCSGIIIETEAYRHYGDKACHSHAGKRTPRNESMYMEGGIAYVYLCYGIHHLFNIVCNRSGKADAVLIRALMPLEGKEVMQQRLGGMKKRKDHELCNGPGKLSKALGINRTFDRHLLDAIDADLFILDSKRMEVAPLVARPRIGIDYAEEDAFLPWRWYPKGSKYISKP